MSAMPAPDDSMPTDDAVPGNAGHERADWLVGAEEGLAAEMSRREADSNAMNRPELRRPSLPTEGSTPLAPPARVVALGVPAPAPERARPAARPIGVAQPDEGSDITRGAAMVWQPGTLSVPMVRGPANTPRVPQPTHDFPMDDAEERARDLASAAASAAAAAATPHDVVSPDAFDLAAGRVPWWMQLVHALRTDRRIQVLLAVVIVVLVTIALWPRGERPVSIAALRGHPKQYDGVDIRVDGHVGEVFRVGQGYAFYLLDGRDTLVVFTRARVPRTREHVELLGELSTGYLDGQPTLALFESTTR